MSVKTWAWNYGSWEKEAPTQHGRLVRVSDPDPNPGTRSARAHSGADPLSYLPPQAPPSSNSSSASSTMNVQFIDKTSTGTDQLSAHTHSHDGASHSHEHGDHGHTHEHLEHPGEFCTRPLHETSRREGSPLVLAVGSGKTALTLALCQKLRKDYNIATVTNDIFTREDQEFLIKNKALPSSRILAIETGGCPHAAIREDISANMGALETLQAKFGCQILFVESGGDNLAANYSRELADYIIYVIDVAGGDKIPRKGGPGISQSDLLVVNKIDLAPMSAHLSKSWRATQS
ncbi:hypothetical protein NMY22_g11236 [Coprinellus aureogranulatus]|nr:hypothetical protein NMY22_g11236 [Coprinellus aureogranulatus]